MRLSMDRMKKSENSTALIGRILGFILISTLSSVGATQETCWNDKDENFHKEKGKLEYDSQTAQRILIDCLGGYENWLKYAKGKKSEKVLGDEICSAKIPSACTKNQKHFCSVLKEVSKNNDEQQVRSEQIYTCQERLRSAAREKEKQSPSGAGDTRRGGTVR